MLRFRLVSELTAWLFLTLSLFARMHKRILRVNTFQSNTFPRGFFYLCEFHKFERWVYNAEVYLHFQVNI